MKDAEDEAFEELALKQGQWNHASGWRKKQIMEQAFPNPHRTDMTGMTLRDYFAAHVAVGMMSDYWNGDRLQDPTFVDIAQQAYALADAMMKAREA
jgi:hypothetical protein